MLRNAKRFIYANVSQNLENMKKFILFILFVATISEIHSQTPFINKELQKGNFNVGFKRIWEIDKSRVWPRSSNIDSLEGNVNRPIRIDVWYPAQKNGNDEMLFREYVYPITGSQKYEDINFLTKRWDIYSYKGLTEDSLKFEKLMNTKIPVFKNAEPIKKRFPLVIYSAGWYNRSPDNTILAEFLASHGFIVATVPQLNPGLWTWNFASDFRSVENQTRDLEFAIGKLIRESNVDRTKIAAIGYSTGGDVALLLQGRNELIDCVVGMDASWSLGKDNDVVDSPFFNSEFNNVPILVIRRKTDNKEYNEVLDSLNLSERFIIDIEGSNHGSFSDDPPQREMLGITVTSSSKIHAMVTNIILDFLNHNFDKSTNSNFIKQVKRKGRILSINIDKK